MACRREVPAAAAWAACLAAASAASAPGTPPRSSPLSITVTACTRIYRWPCNDDIVASALVLG